MNNKAVTLSLAMAAIAVLFVESYVSSIEQEAEKKFGAKVNVLVAKKDIKETDTIDETMIELKSIPKRFIEPAAIFFEATDEKKVVRNIKSLAGTVAIIPIREGEQITYNKIIEPGLRTGLAPQITPGKRAVALPVNEVTGVSKLVKPGDRIDIIAVMDIGTARKNRISKTILQDVAVLAVGRFVTNNIPRLIERRPGSTKTQTRSLTRYDGFTSVTVEVDPSQAQMLSLIVADRNNTLSLALRNNDDTQRTPTSTSSVKDVLGAAAANLKRKNRRR